MAFPTYCSPIGWIVNPPRSAHVVPIYRIPGAHVVLSSEAEGEIEGEHGRLRLLSPR
jgi:hypothetical protein